MKHFILITISLFIGLSLFAQEKLSLVQAIEIGIQNNYQIEIARQNLQVATNNNDWGAAGRYPRLDLNLNSNNGYRNARSPGFLLEQSALSGGLTPSIDLAWTIYDGKRVNITKQQLQEVENQTNLGISVATENTVQAIILDLGKQGNLIYSKPKMLT